MNPSPPPLHAQDPTTTAPGASAADERPSGANGASAAAGAGTPPAALNGNGSNTPTPAPPAATSIATSASPAPDNIKMESDDKMTVASAVPGRIPTPSSRTSTPPLAAATKKKFSSVSVNKEFLSKAVSPVPAPVKPRLAAAAAPAQSSSSRLLSTKLTAVPSSKTSTSPKPAGPAPAPTTNASPWAKTPAPLPEPPTVTPLQHPAPTRHGLPNVAMGSGQGLGSGARRAWGPIGGGRMGQMARDFPTAKEVAEGKRAALMVAQAEAAHNQAILAGLNEFTHLEPNAHRWDEEDDDDEVIDFGDGPTFASHKDDDHPVPESDRFADDFDRSWPRSSTSPQRPLRGPPDSGRVLFNASSNRMEPQQHGNRMPLREPREPREREPREREPREPPHGRDLHGRDVPPHARDGHAMRQPPPHLASGDRMLPPHLQSAPHGASSGPASTRPSWRAQPGDREAPPHIGDRPPRDQREHREPREPRSDTHRPGPPRGPVPHGHPPPASPTQPMRPPAPSSHHSVSPAMSTSALPPVAAAAAGVAGEAQAAEMHSAAEKARLRRLAEEQERDAAAERARKKARELAERFGEPKAAPAAAPAPAAPVALAPAPAASGPIAPPPGLPKPPPPPPPGLGKPTPQITIATRPRPDAPAPVPGESRSAEPQAPHPSDRATTWRRTTPLVAQPHTAIPEAEARGPQGRRPSAAGDHPRPPREPREHREPREPRERFNRDAPRDLPPHALPAHPSRERDAPPHAELKTQEPDLAAPVPSKEADWDAMLARLQAAMVKAKADGEETPPGSARVKAAGFMAAAAVAATVVPPASEEPPARPKKQKAQPAMYPHNPPDFFDATESEIPKSPPPAWRQYTVKLPKPTRRIPHIPRWRLRAAEGPGPVVPPGWILTFDPPVANLPSSLSVPDVLLPQPIGRRFAKQVDTGPIVSISPRALVMFERKQKRREDGGSAEVSPKPAPAPAPVQAEPAVTQESPVILPKRAPRADGKDRRFLVDGDTVVKPTDKPGVRFMVSSELDGDSLLDEVNKITLEHMGELEDKSKVIAKERPATPPTVSPARPSATSPSTAQTPWAKSTLAYPVTSPARGAPQHEHLKSVWDGADNTAATASTPASAPSQPDTPLYPSLTAPVAASETSTALKPSFSPMQPNPSAFSMRSTSLGQPGYQYPMGTGGSSPDGGMSMQYGLMGRTSGNGFQQGVWSSSFGSSMATPAFYNANNATKDQKQGQQGQQFQAGTKEGGHAHAQQQQQQQAGYNVNDYRYPQQGGAGVGANGFPPGAGGAYNGYPGQFRSPNVHYGGYAHSGFGQQMAGPRPGPPGGGSRFPSGVNVGVNGVGVDGYQMGYDPNSGYYSGAGAYGPAPGGYGGHSVAGVGGVQQQQGGGRSGAVGGRKMW